MIQLLGWSGNILFGVGAYGLANKKIYGFQTQFIANILYVIQSLLMNNWSLFWLSVGLGLFNLYGVWKWKKQLKKKINQAELNYAHSICDLYSSI